MTHFHDPSRFSRRRFLEGLGLSAAFLPMLHSEHARGGGAGGLPTRFAAIVWPNGVLHDAFWPTGGVEDFVLPELLGGLEPHREHILILDDIDNRAMMDQFPNYGGHASLPYILTGGPAKYKHAGEDLAMGDSISLDQYIANEYQAGPEATPFHSLVMGVDNQEESKTPHKYISFSGPAIGDQPHAPKVEDDIHAVFTSLFGGAGDEGGGLDELIAKTRAERRSILDYVGRDLERFSERLGTQSRQKVEVHLASIRTLEQRLDDVGGAAGEPPNIDPAIDPYAKEHYDQVALAQIDLTVAAFASNLTRNATLLWSNSHNNSWVFSWLGGEFAEAGDGSFNPLRSHHEMAHRGGGGGGGDDQRRKNTVDKYFIDKFAYFIEKCRQVNEGAGSMLDSCALLMANNMSNGAAHSNDRLPWILAGSCGGYFGTGRYLRQDGGRPHNGVLVGIANAMGTPVDTFGDSSYGGELPGLR